MFDTVRLFGPLDFSIHSDESISKSAQGTPVLDFIKNFQKIILN